MAVEVVVGITAAAVGTTRKGEGTTAGGIEEITDGTMGAAGEGAAGEGEAGGTRKGADKM